MNGQGEGGGQFQASVLSRYTANQAYLRVRYTENCEQARHHETLRERTTSMVAATTGVMLGLLGLKERAPISIPIGVLIAVFVIVLGVWGIVSAESSEKRIRRHRERIDEIRALLEPNFDPVPPTKRTRWVWVTFHSGVMVLGMALLVVVVCPALGAKPNVAPAAAVGGGAGK